MKSFDTHTVNKTDLKNYFAKTHEDLEIIHQVKDKYPVKLTPHIEKLARESEAIRLQYLPHPKEIISYGTATPFEEGKKASKIYGLERLYRDRVLITPHFDCPAYCRFCYKKSRVMRNKPNMTIEDINKAVFEIGNMQEVRGALITGGDPLMDKEKLFYLLDKLTALSNITEIRVGSRTLLTTPHIFTDELCDKLASYTIPNFQEPEKSQYLAINVHFNHYDELSPEVIEACYKLTSRGITLRNQTVLLKGINDSVETMSHLFQQLLRNNIIPYYMNHCMPVEGSDYLRTSVQKGLDIYKHLCTESSTSIPHYVYAPSGGKVHVGPDSKFIYEKRDNLNLIKVKMLYDAKEFKNIAKKELPPMHWESEDGKIEGYYIDGRDD
ncbi:MAG: radical SAM protein [Salinivirgaceae bacterium]|nr:radical SAM protein [Salinivirgaceae bacterium]